MKRKWVLLILLASLLITSVSQSVFAQTQFAIPHLVVNTGFLNVRSGDGPQYSVVVTVPGGTELPVLGENKSGTWFLVTTPAGPGWVDVSFTIPRGDFSHVPVVATNTGNVIQLPTPVTIGLLTSFTVSAAAPVTVISTPFPGFTGATHAFLNVISVNLHTQPTEGSAIVGIVFKDPNAYDYAVVGFGSDEKNVPWVAIIVPKLGTGWIEEPKVTLHQVTTYTAPATTITAAAITVPTTITAQSAVPAQSSAHVVVNTSYQNIRLGPGPQFAILAVVPGGTSLPVIGVTTDGTWYLVTGDFGQGWISSQYVLFRGDYSSVPVLKNAY